MLVVIYGLSSHVASSYLSTAVAPTTNNLKQVRSACRLHHPSLISPFLIHLEDQEATNVSHPYCFESRIL